MKFLPKKQIILFDLEYADPKECEFNGWDLEILEIGACKVDHVLNEVEWFQSFICPKRLEILTPSIKMLTGIEDSYILAAPPIETVMKQFIEFCGHTSLMSWSTADFNVITKTYGSWPFVYPYFDALSYSAGVLAEYDKRIDSYSLKALCQMFDVPEPKHSAVGDVKCTIELLRKIMNLSFQA
jgi:DNA polymerase III alpha subunit (gram-positive type)